MYSLKRVLPACPDPREMIVRIGFAGLWFGGEVRTITHGRPHRRLDLRTPKSD